MNRVRKGIAQRGAHARAYARDAMRIGEKKPCAVAPVQGERSSHAAVLQTPADQAGEDSVATINEPPQHFQPLDPQRSATHGGREDARASRVSGSLLSALVESRKIPCAARPGPRLACCGGPSFASLVGTSRLRYPRRCHCVVIGACAAIISDRREKEKSREDRLYPCAERYWQAILPWPTEGTGVGLIGLRRQRKQSAHRPKGGDDRCRK